MKPKILDTERDYDDPAETVVSMVEEAVGYQMSPTEFDHIQRHLSGEDYTIAQRFFPSLKHLVKIVECQKNDLHRHEMILQLAVSARYAVWDSFDPMESEHGIQLSVKECCRLFLEDLMNFKDTEKKMSTSDIDSRRYLLSAIAACWGDAKAAELMHDLASK